MRKGLFPVLAGIIITMWLLAEVLETQINTATPLLQALLLLVVGLVVIGAILLAMWDTEMIGGKRNKK